MRTQRVRSARRPAVSLVSEACTPGRRPNAIKTGRGRLGRPGRLERHDNDDPRRAAGRTRRALPPRTEHGPSPPKRPSRDEYLDAPSHQDDGARRTPSKTRIERPAAPDGRRRAPRIFDAQCSRNGKRFKTRAERRVSRSGALRCAKGERQRILLHSNPLRRRTTPSLLEPRVSRSPGPRCGGRAGRAARRSGLQIVLPPSPGPKAIRTMRLT